ncbi:MAG: hypothetical protein V4613_10265 [Bacteroidota bacterium]
MASRYFILILLFLLSNLTILAQQKELNVVSYSQSKCQGVERSCVVQPRIIEQTISGDTLKTIIGVISNCSGISRVFAYSTDGALWLYYTQGTTKKDTAVNGEVTIVQSSSRCECCFEFTFYTSGIERLPTATFVNYKELKFHPNKYQVTPVQFNIYQGDTVNYIDKFGRKQGKWLSTTISDIRHEFDSINFIGYYVDSYVKQCDFKTYFKNGKIEFEKKQTNFSYFTSTEYDEDGTIKVKNIASGDLVNISRIYYYKNGNIQSFSNSDTFRLYYENGQVKKEDFLKSRNDHLKSTYHYDNGKIMAKRYRFYGNKTDIYYKWRCYNKKGRRTSLKRLVKQGYLTKKDIQS